MKRLVTWRTASFAVACLLVVGFLACGCAAMKPPDWKSRVGAYTFDQAVTEMGPPDKQATLSDGRTVAEWINRRAGGASFSFGTGFYGRGSAVGVGQTIGSSYRDNLTRLTFDKDGRLVDWATGR